MNQDYEADGQIETVGEDLQPIIRDQGDLEGLGSPYDWAQFKSDLNEFKDQIIEVDINSSKEDIAAIRMALGREADKLRTQNQPHLAQIIVLLDTAVENIVKFYQQIRSHRLETETFVSNLLALEQFVEKQEVIEKTEGEDYQPIAQEEPKATKE